MRDAREVKVTINVGIMIPTTILDVRQRLQSAFSARFTVDTAWAKCRTVKSSLSPVHRMLLD